MEEFVNGSFEVREFRERSAPREEAEERLGEKFDIREFHNRILENGAVPLGAMRSHVEEWIEEVESD